MIRRSACVVHIAQMNVMHQLKLIDLGNVRDALRTLHSDEGNKSLTIVFT